MKWRYAGSYIYATIPDQDLIAVMTTAGSLVSTFAGPGTRAYCCGGYSSFYVGDADTHTIYENGVPVITGIATPTGLDVTGYAGDGPAEVWLAVADDATDRVYIYGNATAVIPSSLGRVKAVYK